MIYKHDKLKAKKLKEVKIVYKLVATFYGKWIWSSDTKKEIFFDNIYLAETALKEYVIQGAHTLQLTEIKYNNINKHKREIPDEKLLVSFGISTSTSSTTSEYEEERIKYDSQTRQIKSKETKRS